MRSFITFALKQNIKCQNSQLLVTKLWREIHLKSPCRNKAKNTSRSHLYFFYFVDKYYNTFRRANVLYALTRQCWDGGWPRDILSFIRLSVLFLVIEESDYRNLFAETIWKWKHTQTHQYLYFTYDALEDSHPHTANSRPYPLCMGNI